jgi:TPR repeat protein
LLASASLALSACTTTSDVFLLPAGSGPEMAELAARAEAGDKQAQFDLGMRFETGDGVPINPKRARQLYTLAASDSGGPVWAYSPPVGDRPGTMVQVRNTPIVQGLPEAERRLYLMKQRGMR